MVLWWRLIGTKVTVSNPDGVKAKVTILDLYVAEYHADGLLKSQYCGMTITQSLAITETLSVRLAEAIASIQATAQPLKIRLGSKTECRAPQALHKLLWRA